VLPSNTYPAATTAKSSHGLSLPTALEGSEVHCPRALLTRYVPPSGFGYPLDGFLPRIPRRFCFAPAALLGFALRRFLLPQGILGVSTAEEPTYRFSCLLHPTPKCQTGQAGRGSWVHTFRKSLATDGDLNRPSLEPPLGFTPIGPSHEGLDPNFFGSPLTRLANSTIARPIHRRLRVSISLRWVPADNAPGCMPPKTTLMGFSHRPPS
jgi:hypothetical protein